MVKQVFTFYNQNYDIKFILHLFIHSINLRVFVNILHQIINFFIDPITLKVLLLLVISVFNFCHHLFNFKDFLFIARIQIFYLFDKEPKLVLKFLTMCLAASSPHEYFTLLLFVNIGRLYLKDLFLTKIHSALTKTIKVSYYQFNFYLL